MTVGRLAAPKALTVRVPPSSYAPILRFPVDSKKAATGISNLFIGRAVYSNPISLFIFVCKKGHTDTQISGGKSWKTPTYYLSLFASVTNLLGTVFKTGGFEQSRKANYRELSEDMGLETPLFGPKYWTAPGVGYYLMLSVYF